MERISKHEILEFHPDTLQAVREACGLAALGRMDEAIDMLQDWVNKQEHLVKKDFSRNYLEITIITSKGSIEKAKQRIDTLCTSRTFVPQLYATVDVKKLMYLREVGIFVPLPKLTADHYRVIAIRLAGMPGASNILEVYRNAIILVENLKLHEYCNANIFVADLRDLHILEFVSSWNMAEFHHFYTVATKGYGARIQAIHVLSPSKTIGVLVAVLKQVLSAKLVSRLHTHKTLEELHRHVPKHILPRDLGGEERTMDTLYDEWLRVCASEKHVAHMREMRDARTDETRRRAELDDAAFGVPGTFRALSVD